MIAEADKVVVRATDRGTFTGPFMGMAPTGNRFTVTWIDIFRIHYGQLQEDWLEIDTADFCRQLQAPSAGLHTLATTAGRDGQVACH